MRERKVTDEMAADFARWVADDESEKFAPCVAALLADRASDLEREKHLAAIIEVYAFTLEFVLLLATIGDEEFKLLDGQVTAAREAYKELTGDDPETMYRRER